MVPGVGSADGTLYWRIPQFEASRLVMIQILLHGLKMDPLVSLHYYAPVCAIINLAILPLTEGLAPFYEVLRIGWVPLPFCVPVSRAFSN